VTIEDDKLRLHRARKVLARAICQCALPDRKHDPFWMKCPKAVAERELDEAMRPFRGHP